MHLYRNLGSITFESETQNFELFTAQPNSCIIQSKSVTLPHQLFQQICSFYNQHLHGEYVKSYSQQQKGSALVISNCQRVDINKLDAYRLCEILLEITTTLNKVSQLIEGWKGDICSQLIRSVNGRTTFVYIPCRKMQRQQLKHKTLVEVLSIADCLKNQEDISNRLLIKKLSKCKTLTEIIDEIKYFLNIYAARKTNQFAINLQGIKRGMQNRSKNKLNLFKMNQVIKKTSSKFQKYQQAFNSWQTRKPTSAAYLSISNKQKSKKQTCSLHSSCRLMASSYTTKNDSVHMSRSNSLKMSQVLENHTIKLQKQQKQILQPTAVSPRVEQQLMQKLKTKRASRIGSRTVLEPKETNTSMIVEELSKKQDLCPKQPSIQKLKTQKDEQTAQIPQQLIIKDGKNRKTCIVQPVWQKQTKLKKKPIVRQHIGDEDIEVISLHRPKPKIQISIAQTKDIPKNAKIHKNQQYKTVQALQSQPPIDSQKSLLQKLRNLDFIGVAVANTRVHLKNFQKIFWQLPMFFLYRQFYLKRLQLTEQMQRNYASSIHCKLLEEQNLKIGQSITKMMSIVERKQKQQDPNSLQQLKPYLNMDKKISCKVPIKTFVGQYIESMIEAIEDYPELLTHAVEVVDALLATKQIKINSQARSKAMKQNQLRRYLDQQKHLLVQPQ